MADFYNNTDKDDFEEMFTDYIFRGNSANTTIEKFEKYKDDDLSPFLGKDNSAPTLPSCSNSEYKLDEKQLKGKKLKLEIKKLYL